MATNAFTYREKRALWAALVAPDDDEKALTAMMRELDRTPATYARTDDELRAEAEALLALERDETPVDIPPHRESVGERIIRELGGVVMDDKTQALRALERKQGRLRALRRMLEREVAEATRERDAALLAAKTARVPDRDLMAALDVSRSSLDRRVKAARESVGS